MILRLFWWPSLEITGPDMKSDQTEQLQSMRLPVSVYEIL